MSVQSVLRGYAVQKQPVVAGLPLDGFGELRHAGLFEPSHDLSDEPVRLFNRVIERVRTMSVGVAGMVYVVEMNKGEAGLV
ncbi:MAG: hypothetical protein IH920_03520 [Chloroflexi bacterium]|nr:hypothetical protein [Chloroflexota bacterium]